VLQSYFEKRGAIQKVIVPAGEISEHGILRRGAGNAAGADLCSEAVGRCSTTKKLLFVP